MSATGLEVFDKTLQTTNIWLDEIMREIGPDRNVAWLMFGAALRTLRDRLTVGLAAHLGAQLPLLIRGVYYDQWRPSELPVRMRSEQEFLECVAQELKDTRPVNPKKAVKSVFHVLNHHVDPNQVANVRDALPHDVRALWPVGGPAGRAA